jgi:hypothetical protein
MISIVSSETQTGSSEPAEEALADPIAEGRRLVARVQEQGVTVRLLGGVAVFLQAPEDRPLLHREIRDIDLVAPRDSKRALEPVFQRLGYVADDAFNAFHGHHRQLYVDLANARKVDVFVGSFSMCHEIPIADRLDREPMTVPLAELLLTKLQIVQLNERDERDIYNLCFHHPVSDTDADAIEGGVIARLCAADWGLWRTVKGTIARCQDDLGRYELVPDARQLIGERLGELWSQIEAAPKSGKWRRRNRLGERMRWYQEPEEE